MKKLSSIIALMGALALTAGFVEVSVAGQASELPTLEVALPEDGMFGLGGQYLMDKGIDRKHGFIVKPRWAALAEAEKLVAFGTVHLGISTAESAVRANLSDIALRLISPYQTPHNSILVRKDAPYKNLKDLKDKPFAMPPEVTSAYNNFDYMMKKDGIQIEKFFQLKKLGAPGISATLERGEVEAGYTWEAHASKLLATGKYRVLVTPRDELNRILNTKVKLLGWLGTSESWAAKNAALIPKIRAAWSETIKGVQDDEVHFRKHAKRLFGLETEEELKIGWPRTKQFFLPRDFSWPDKANLDIEKRYLRESVELGIFPKDALKFIDVMFIP
jgi:ABC-type nitrate/sulfonate/bicarbonate transport system substrate-binding protein